MIVKIEIALHFITVSNGIAVVNFLKMGTKIGWNSMCMHGTIGSDYTPNTNIIADWNESSITTCTIGIHKIKLKIDIDLIKYFLPPVVNKEDQITLLLFLFLLYGNTN